jgi:histidinol-phosphate aminotransferase
MASRTRSTPRRPPGLLAAVTPRTKVVFLCSPNNPTGNGWSSGELEAVRAAGVPTVVDQAYLECGHAESFAPLVARHPNLVVTRTFSKAFGLADAALRLRIPFSLGLPALWAVAAALEDPADIEARREFISSERDRVFNALTKLEGVEPYPSEGNFILMNVADASGRTNDEIIRLAHAERILLRAMGSHRLKGTHVRVIIGRTEQNDRFLDLFGRLFA